jgi:hypothetical protein
MRGISMGLKELFGTGTGANAPPTSQRPKSNPGYDRIEVWIESRVGKLDPTDAVLKSRLEN